MAGVTCLVANVVHSALKNKIVCVYISKQRVILLLCRYSIKLNITVKSMCSLKWNIFLNKVIAPGEAGSNNK